MNTKNTIETKYYTTHAMLFGFCVIVGIAAIVIGLFIVNVPGASAEPTIDDISKSIENKEAEIEGIKRKINSFEEKIRGYEQAEHALGNEIGILENREKKTQLDIEQNELQISKTELEVRRLQNEIKETHEVIAAQKDIVRDVLQELYVYGDDSPLEIVFGNEQFSDYFDQLQYLELLQDDLQGSIKAVQDLQARLETQSVQEEEHKDRLLAMRSSLNEARQLLEEEQRSKDVLLAATERSEAQFRVLLRELRGEQQYINAEVFRLQQRLEQQFEDNDAIPDGPTVLSWPVSDPILTATYHDPTYPFRHLFEHSGLDMAIPQGSTVRAAAPGYVAWTRTGRSYGNYIMIIHTNGIATLYAHLSGFNVSADQFVERGQPIGLSGGMPGTAGAGLSTGPHLHFEVREQGIPMNPLNYLVSQ